MVMIGAIFVESVRVAFIREWHSIVLLRNFVVFTSLRPGLSSLGILPDPVAQRKGDLVAIFLTSCRVRRASVIRNPGSVETAVKANRSFSRDWPKITVFLRIPALLSVGFQPDSHILSLV